VDQGSDDDTTRIAIEHGARVYSAPGRRYGAACLRGIEVLNAPDIVVFLDGHHGHYPEEMPLLVDPVIHGEVDLMIGSRTRSARESGSVIPQTAFGNWLATRLIRLFWGIQYTDLGPFRAIRFRTLCQLGLAEQKDAWDVEMQIKAALHVVPADETPVSYRPTERVTSASGGAPAMAFAVFRTFSTILLHALFSNHHLKTALLTFFVTLRQEKNSALDDTPQIGAESTRLQSLNIEQFLERSIPPLAEVETQIRYCGGDRMTMRTWLGPEHLYVAQGEGDTGERLSRALEEGFYQAYGKVVVCGCECPELSARHTGEAFKALDSVDLVLGPDAQGGFYLLGLGLIGAPEDMPQLFNGVAWGTASVREQILVNAEKLGLSVEVLETLRVTAPASEPGTIENAATESTVNPA
jgi:glycosyltransferase A (GT-A) superfamily protein (DUF2064 family)